MVKQLTIGALILGRHSPDILRRMACNCEQWGFDYLWLADERFFRDVYAQLTLCALVTSRVKLGTGVTDPYSRHPALTAMGIATIDEISGGRAILGIGAGISGFKEMGLKVHKPTKAIREAVEFIRLLMTNRPITYHGEFVHFDHGVLNVPGRPDLPIFIAGMGPMNIQLAGQIADGLIISSCVADAMIDHTLELLAKGAKKAGRDPSQIILASRVNVAISDHGEHARQAVKPMIAALLVSKKPDFSFLEPLGLRLPEKLAEAVEKTSYGHDRAEIRRVADLIPDEFVDALTVAGTPDEVAESIRRMARRGVGQLIVYPVPCHGDTEENVLRRLATEIIPGV